MTLEQLLALEEFRPQQEAIDLLARANSGEIDLSPKGWYQVTLLATGGDEAAAEAAHNDELMRLLKAGKPVGETI